MATPEGKVKERFRVRMKAAFGGDQYSFMPVQTGLGAPTLDKLICFRGWFVAVEFKRPGGKMTPRQEVTAQQIRDAGGLVFLVDGDEATKQCLSQLAELTRR